VSGLVGPEVDLVAEELDARRGCEHSPQPRVFFKGDDDALDGLPFLFKLFTG